MSDIYSASRRGFLRNALATAVLSPALAGLGRAQESVVPGAVNDGADAAVLGRISLDHAVANQEGTLNGTLRFLRAVSGPLTVRWMDSFGRVAGEQRLTLKDAVASTFSFNMRAGLTYVNWVRVTINNVPQAATAKFMLSPAPAPWDDFHTISWAHYPDGYYDQLRSVGMDAIIAYTKENNEPVLDNNFRFYVEQMAWEVFSIYHKDQPEWRELLTKVSHDRGNLELWSRSPCVNDPETKAYLKKYLTEYVRQHKAYRPLFYNIADELGQADQIRPNDFCHSKFCTAEFAKYLRKEYRQPSGVAGEWQTGSEMTHWDDAHFHATPDWDKSGTMIGNTTTDLAFQAIALAAIRNRYKTIGQFNQEWGTSFPVSHGNTTPMRDGWNPILTVARESLSVPELTPAALEKQMGSLSEANARWGGLGEWDAPDEPTKFASWDEVIAFINRFYKELGEVTSTRGWNVSAWCDFRNFMDETFADAVKRAADICKEEDANALCGTEGGQSPFAFGWYNYEQVLRAVDVIEPYNIGNNVEVVRSLKSSAIMMSTHGFGGFSSKPGQPLTDREKLEQKRSTQPIWWGLFHKHNAALIWDDNEPENKFVDLETGQVTVSGETFSPIFHELRAGIGKLFINADRKQDGIAIHYSQPSIQIHWLLDNLKHARNWPTSSGGTSDSICIAVRNSWTKLIEDLGLQYNFVGRKSIEVGDLSSGEYKVFIMPESVAVSEKEAAAIRGFVQAGGTVIADCRAADLNARGRDLGKGLLDDVFGIRRGEAKNADKSIRGIANDGPIQLSGKPLQGVRVGDTGIELAGGKALAQSGDVPLVIVNRVGEGQAIYLNLEIADYAYLRLKGSDNTSLPELVESALAAASVKPRIRVLGADGKRLPGTEIVRFANGNCEQVAIFRNPQFDSGGWGAYPKLLASGSTPLLDPQLGNIDNHLLEQEAEITIEWPLERQTYDIRARKDLGKLQMQKATLNPFEPLVFTRSNQLLPGLKIAVQNARAGEMIEIVLTGEGDLPEGAFRVVHLEFKAPGGKLYDLYSRNVLARAFPYTERVPFAFNDPTGKWKVTAHDLISGQVVETTFALA